MVNKKKVDPISIPTADVADKEIHEIERIFFSNESLDIFLNSPRGFQNIHILCRMLSIELHMRKLATTFNIIILKKFYFYLLYWINSNRNGINHTVCICLYLLHAHVCLRNIKKYSIIKWTRAMNAWNYLYTVLEKQTQAIWHNLL